MKSGDAKVFFLNNKLVESDTSALRLLALKHPGTGSKSHYYTKDEEVYESIEFSEKNRSFFINDYVASNGKIYFLTRVDPLFLLAQYFILQTRPTPIDDILYDTKYPDLVKLAEKINLKQLALIADQKGPADLKAYIFNEEKFLYWLTCKTTNLIETIKTNNLKVKQTATSDLYNKTELHSTDEAGEQEYIKSAHAIISDYISLEHSQKLENILGLNASGAQNKKRKYMDSNVEDESSGNSKKVKTNNLVVESAKEKKVSAKEKAMEKAAKGTKSISSFFGAKPKK